jgi:hypothetical protein
MEYGIAVIGMLYKRMRNWRKQTSSGNCQERDATERGPIRQQEEDRVRLLRSEQGATLADIAKVTECRTIRHFLAPRLAKRSD